MIRDSGHFLLLSSEKKRVVKYFLRKKYGENWNDLMEQKLYVEILKNNRKKEAEEDCILEDAVCDCAKKL
jgi:hypothetical protein